MSSQPQPSGGYSLFPNPNPNSTSASNSNGQPPSSWRPPSRTRRSESQERPVTTREPALGTGSAATSVPALHPIDTTPPRAGRRTPQRRERPSGESARSPQDARQSPADGNPRAGPRRERTPVLVQQPPPASSIPPRSDTAFSEAQTLVRDNSNRSRSSIAKLPINDGPSASSSLPSSQQPARPEQPLRSIFPQYDPEVPLSRQEYFPTQTSPTHIPRAVISRAGYQPQEEDVDAQSPAVAMGSPLTTTNQRQVASQQAQATTTSRWPRRNNLEMPPLPVESSTEQLKGLWKVLNGWRATSAEGRVFCMKLSQEKDAPVYTLSSKQQPFYNLRLDPTSVAAHVTISRHDPSKAYKAPSSPSSTSGAGGNGGGGGSSSSSSSILNNVVGKDPAVKASAAAAESSKNWQEALSTTLEEESRRHRPNDGLVALLYPTAAAKLALDRPSDAHAVAAAEGECARLVWDGDAAAHFLCHPALATPFCVTIERNPAWSRVEYTLEHHESPQHVAKLTRDGTGAGWLEVDTAVAGRIESFFVLDVAVAALLIVAAGDERTRQVETFEPPPLPPALLAGGGGGRRADGGSKRSSFLGRGARRKGSARKMDEFEIDVESQSQDHEFAKFELATKKTRKKLPWPLRFTFKVLGGLFKCFIWTLTMAFKTVVALVVGLAKCTGLASKGG